MITQLFTGPPTITSKNVTNQVIAFGKRTTLICTANVRGIITYQWQKLDNAGLWKNIYNTNKKNYRTDKLKESSQFRCVVSNEVGEAMSFFTVDVLSEDTYHMHCCCYYIYDSNHHSSTKQASSS